MRKSEAFVNAISRRGVLYGTARIKGCFVIGHRRAKLLHLPARTAAVWSHDKARLVAETKCQVVLHSAKPLLRAPEGWGICDGYALADHIPFVVYRFFDARDRLLYVGFTCNFPARLKSHRTGTNASAWYPLVARWSLVSFDDQASALEYERLTIQKERPLYNKRHNDAVAA